MSRLDLTDPTLIAKLTAALQAAGVDGIEIESAKQALTIRLRASASCPRKLGQTGKLAATTVKAPIAGEFWPMDPSRPVSAGAAQVSDFIGFLRNGPILLPIRPGEAKRLVRHSVQPGAIVGFGDPIAEVEPEA